MSSDLTSAGGGSGITALTGDVTASGSGSQAATIPTSVISTFMRTVTDDADAAAARATLGIPTIVAAVTSAQFDKTNNALADVTGLSISATAGTWIVSAQLSITTDGTTGFKVGMGGTATYTNAVEAVVHDEELPGVESEGRLADLVGNAAVGSSITGLVTLNGTIAVSVAGTVTVKFAQFSTGASPASVLVGAFITATKT